MIEKILFGTVVLSALVVSVLAIITLMEHNPPHYIILCSVVYLWLSVAYMWKCGVG